MTITDQPTLTFPTASDPDVTALLALIAGDPIHDRDREAVVTAIRDAARASDGIVDPNEVRALMPESVYPRVIGATYSALAARGVLTPAGWVLSTDKRGKNGGKPARTYRWTGAAL